MGPSGTRHEGGLFSSTVDRAPTETFLKCDYGVTELRVLGALSGSFLGRTHQCGWHVTVLRCVARTRLFRKRRCAGKKQPVGYRADGGCQRPTFICQCMQTCLRVNHTRCMSLHTLHADFGSFQHVNFEANCFIPEKKGIIQVASPQQSIHTRGPLPPGMTRGGPTEVGLR